MKSILLMIVCFFLCCFSMEAQNAEDSVKVVVSNLFTAMKNSDSVLLKSCFAENSILQTIIKNKEGHVSVKNESLQEFTSSVGKQPKGALDEQIVFDMIKIDGPLAMVWTSYRFFFQEKFSHCGVNSFQLVKVANEWKIQYLIDTRRKTGCD